MIYIYRFFLNIILIISPLIILIRLINKKEDPKRFLEKFTIFSKIRKKGKLIWFHTVSVGELKSVLPLLKRLEKDKNISQILITSSTLSSSRMFYNLKFKKTIHQFFPIDNNFITKRFLKYWSPDLAIFVDSEIWPNMLKNLKKKNIKRILINARISKRSFKKWKILGSFAKDLFQTFNFCYPQNQESKEHLKKIGAFNIKFLGNIKFIQNEINQNSLEKNFKRFIKSKNVWGAISTHPGEEKICAEIHLSLLKKYKNLLLILIPRHTNRINDIKKELINFDQYIHVRSEKKPINKNTKIYLVDTYGETDLFFEISKIVFMGKSLSKINLGGQNPLEAARKNCIILHGPKVSNFNEIYNYLDKQKISISVKNKNQFLNKMMFLLKNKSNSKKIQNKLNKIGTQILKLNLKEIRSFIK